MKQTAVIRKCPSCGGKLMKCDITDTRDFFCSGCGLSLTWGQLSKEQVECLVDCNYEKQNKMQEVVHD